MNTFPQAEGLVLLGMWLTWPLSMPLVKVGWMSLEITCFSFIDHFCFAGTAIGFSRTLSVCSLAIIIWKSRNDINGWGNKYLRSVLQQHDATFRKSAYQGLVKLIFILLPGVIFLSLYSAVPWIIFISLMPLTHILKVWIVSQTFNHKSTNEVE